MKKKKKKKVVPIFQDDNWLQKVTYTLAKTQVNGLAIIFCFLGASFMILLVILTSTQLAFSSKWIYLIPGIFALIALGILYELLFFKQYTVDNHLFRVKYVVLRLEQVFELQKVESFQLQNYKIESQHRGSTYNVHKGNQCALVFQGGRTIKFNSFYIQNFYFFSASLIRGIAFAEANIDRKTLQESYNQLKIIEQQRRYKNEYIKFWLVFFGMLSAGLLYTILKR